MKKFSESQIDYFIKSVHAKEKHREARREKEEDRKNNMQPNPIASDATRSYVFQKPQKKPEVSGFIKKIRSRSKKRMYNDIMNQKTEAFDATKYYNKDPLLIINEDFAEAQRRKESDAMMEVKEASSSEYQIVEDPFSFDPTKLLTDMLGETSEQNMDNKTEVSDVDMKSEEPIRYDIPTSFLIKPPKMASPEKEIKSLQIVDIEDEEEDPSDEEMIISKKESPIKIPQKNSMVLQPALSPRTMLERKLKNEEALYRDQSSQRNFIEVVQSQTPIRRERDTSMMSRSFSSSEKKRLSEINTPDNLTELGSGMPLPQEQVNEYLLFEDFDNNFEGEDLEDVALDKLREKILEDKVCAKQALDNLEKYSETLFPSDIEDDIRDLLFLFGIPWVDSPFEAEAQCAFLERAGLVDGVITQDSDVFLFGARKVYRNFFEKNKFTQLYDMNKIKKELGTCRDDLIKMALFLGSDYTLGVKRIGIVNAVEIVHAFQGDGGLSRFKKWADDSQSLFEEDPAMDEKEKEYRRMHKKYKRHWEFPADFPSAMVTKAYSQPLVDDSKERFEWGVPKFEELRQLAVGRLHWLEHQIAEYLGIVENKMKNKQEQRKIDDYFLREERFAEFKSKRVLNAVTGLTSSIVSFCELEDRTRIKTGLRRE